MSTPHSNEPAVDGSDVERSVEKERRRLEKELRRQEKKAKKASESMNTESLQTLKMNSYVEQDACEEKKSTKRKKDNERKDLQEIPEGGKHLTSSHEARSQSHGSFIDAAIQTENVIILEFTQDIHSKIESLGIPFYKSMISDESLREKPTTKSKSKRNETPEVGTSQVEVLPPKVEIDLTAESVEFVAKRKRVDTQVDVEASVEKQTMELMTKPAPALKDLAVSTKPKENPVSQPVVNTPLSLESIDARFKQNWAEYEAEMTKEVNATQQVSKILNESQDQIKAVVAQHNHESKSHASLLENLPSSSMMSTKSAKNPSHNYYVKLPPGYICQQFKTMRRENLWGKDIFPWKDYRLNKNEGYLFEVNIASNVQECNFYVQKLMDDLEADYQTHNNPGYPKVLGLDIEWKPQLAKKGTEPPVALIQLSSGERVVLIHILRVFGVSWPLMQLLKDPNILKVGVGIMEDAAKLRRQYRFNINGCIDLCYLARTTMGPLAPRGLQKLAIITSKFLFKKDFKVTISNWETFPLSEFQVKYACVDSIAGREILYGLYNRFKSTTKDEISISMVDWIRKYHIEGPAGWAPREEENREVPKENKTES